MFGQLWATHKPPKLMRARLGRALIVLARLWPFSHLETEVVGAVADHHAHATKEQV